MEDMLIKMLIVGRDLDLPAQHALTCPALTKHLYKERGVRLTEVSL